MKMQPQARVSWFASVEITELVGKIEFPENILVHSYLAQEYRTEFEPVENYHTLEIVEKLMALTV
jgi:hypothetical protein